MKIVTGVDGSDTADAAAMVAGRLAKALGAELHVVSAYRKYQVEHFDGGTQQVSISTEVQAQAVADRSARRIHEAFPDIVLLPTSAMGKPAEALVEHAELIDAVLIVVGNKRVQGIARVLGSIAKDVSSLATCDVYIANTHAP